MRILIAEDDITSRSILVSVLRKAGHAVVETANGLEAWEALQKPDAPKLAILDWMMPGLDGIDVVQRIRAIASDQPPYILMLPSKTDKAAMIAGLDAGANDYLAKPFDVGELRARIEVGRRMVELQAMLAEKIGELQRALNEIKTLRGIVPICASCKKIRDDAGFWQQVDVYVRDHSEAEFSHGICPECMKRPYPEFTADSEP